MILIDYREKAPGQTDKQQLTLLFKRLGVPSDTTDLSYGDFAFEGRGPAGTMLVGVERKRLHDMLNCIDDARYNGHQRVGMRQMYQASFLLIEGLWRPHDPSGVLMEGFNGGASWRECRYRSQRVMYAKLRRYLFSVALTGVHVLYTRDLFQSAYDICELFHYFQKPWDQHTAMLQKHTLNLPALTSKPSLTYRWAAEIEGVGVKKGKLAEQHFKTPEALAGSRELDWVQIPGIGMKTATSIVAQIEGKKR